LTNSEKFNKRKKKIQPVSCPAYALGRHTNFDPETKEGTIILMTHFISQSAPDIRKNLKEWKMALRLHRLEF
jgi:hypothetical protein